jgi:hypothetical protein
MSVHDYTIAFELSFLEDDEQEIERLRFALGDTTAIRREYAATERGSERWVELRARMQEINYAKAYVRGLLESIPGLSNAIICQFVRALYGGDRPDSVARVRRWLCKV